MMVSVGVMTLIMSISIPKASSLSSSSLSLSLSRHAAYVFHDSCRRTKEKKNGAVIASGIPCFLHCGDFTPEKRTTPFIFSAHEVGVNEIPSMNNDEFQKEGSTSDEIIAGGGNAIGSLVYDEINHDKNQLNHDDEDHNDDDEWNKLENVVGRPIVSSEEETKKDNAQASKQQEEDTFIATEAIEAPDVTKIIKFAIPAVGVWLCSPLLSLIDTSAVGLLSGTTEQAALNPAVSVTDYGGLLVAFMYTATTNLVAAAQGIDSNNNNNDISNRSPCTTRTIITALQLSLMVGLAFGTFLGVFGGPLLRALMGNGDQIDPAVFSAALRYVRIRAIGIPAAVVIGSAQSACLGMQDVKSPLYVLIAAAVVNFVGDVLFVRNSNPWVGGAAGAAWATTISQYTALFLFLKWLKHKPQTRSMKSRRRGVSKGEQNLDDSVDVNAVNRVKSRSNAKYSKRKKYAASALLQKLQSSFRESANSDKRSIVGTKKATDEKISSATPKSRGFLHGHFKNSDLLKWSKIDAPTAKEFQQFVVPVTISSVGRISGYIAMSHVASSALGTMDMAAQQIVFSFFCCLTPLVDALSQTAQSFVPTIFEKQKSLGRTKALRKTYDSFFKAGGIFGASIIGLVASIPFLSRFFTTDLSVIAKVHGAIPGLMTFFAFGGLMCVGEGMLLGQKDLKFLGRMYGAYFFIVPYIMLRLKRRALLGIQDVGIGTMWGLFSIYQLVRVAIWHARLKQLQRRTEKETLVFAPETS